MAAGSDLVCEIDCQGAEQLRDVYADAVAIFILPPSLAELERRLRARATDSEEVIRRRLTAASREMARSPGFDYAIINADFSVALAQLQAVVAAARLRVARVAGREPALFSSLGIRLE